MTEQNDAWIIRDALQEMGWGFWLFHGKSRFSILESLELIKQCANIFLYLLGNSKYRRGDDRQSRSHRFENDSRKTFDSGTADEDIGGGIVERRIGCFGDNLYFRSAIGWKRPVSLS